MRTCWAESDAGTGIGEWIQLSSSELQTVRGIRIYNGYHKNIDIFEKNGAATSVRIDFSDGTYIEADDLLCSLGEAKEIGFPEIETDYIRITITGAVPGTKYSDACISEIEVY